MFLSFFLSFFGLFFLIRSPESRVQSPVSSRDLDFAGGVNHQKHVQFRSRVKLNCLIKVEVYLLFEFTVGRIRGKNYVSTLELII